MQYLRQPKPIKAYAGLGGFSCHAKLAQSLLNTVKQSLWTIWMSNFRRFNLIIEI
jgi:hypothetical protein